MDRRFNLSWRPCEISPVLRKSAQGRLSIPLFEFDHGWQIWFRVQFLMMAKGIQLLTFSWFSYSIPVPGPLEPVIPADFRRTNQLA